MVQHIVLMQGVALLCVVGRPLAAWAWLWPGAGRRLPAALVDAWSLATSLWVATVLQLAALWLWHAPRLFDAATSNEAVHTLQHASFLVTGIAFWSAILRPGSSAERGAAVALFVTMLVTGGLGALITFAPAPWYAAYAVPDAGGRLTPLEDQQLGGLLMWVPGGLVYPGMALWLLGRRLAARPRAAPAGAR